MLCVCADANKTKTPTHCHRFNEIRITTARRLVKVPARTADYTSHAVRYYAGPPLLQPATFTVTPTWYVYIMRTDDDQWWTGMTTDVQCRWQEHDRGRAGARYFRGRTPKQLFILEPHPARSSATRREIAINCLSRTEKLKLIAA